MLKKWIKSRSSVSIGIDISSDNIHVVVANKRAEEFSILHKITARNDHEDSLPQTLRTSVLLSYLSRAKVITGISDELVIEKKLQLDVSFSDGEIEKYVEEYAKIIFPECSFDFRIIGINSADSNKIDVEAVIANKKEVNSHLMKLEKAGYHVDIVDINSKAIQRTMNYFSQEEIKNMGEEYIISVGLAMRA